MFLWHLDVKATHSKSQTIFFVCTIHTESTVFLNKTMSKCIMVAALSLSDFSKQGGRTHQYTTGISPHFFYISKPLKLYYLVTGFGAHMFIIVEPLRHLHYAPICITLRTGLCMFGKQAE